MGLSKSLYVCIYIYIYRVPKQNMIQHCFHVRTSTSQQNFCQIRMVHAELPIFFGDISEIRTCISSVNFTFVFVWMVQQFLIAMCLFPWMSVFNAMTSHHWWVSAKDGAMEPSPQQVLQLIAEADDLALRSQKSLDACLEATGLPGQWLLVTGPAFPKTDEGSTE